MMNFLWTFLSLVYLATTCSATCPYSTEQPEVVLPKTEGVRCVTVTDDEPSNVTYYDDERIQSSGVTFYSAFTGHLEFFDNTPEYCFDEKKRLVNFNLNFDNKIKYKMITTAGIVTCRSNGFWTDGQQVCSPPECAHYINQPESIDYFEEKLFVTLNMNDINSLNVSIGVIILSFESPSDPRVVFNKTTNTSTLLSTDDFVKLCSLYGPCREGKFNARNDTLYAFSGYPSLIMKKDGRNNTIFLAVRHDSRPFVTTAKDDSCNFGKGLKSKVCTSSFGTQSFQKLWESALPFNKEWLSLKIVVRWSFKENCKITMKDTETDETLVNFNGPCGRYADMKRGNYPVEKIGIYTHGMRAPFKVRYRDIRVRQIGAMKTSE